MSVIGPVMSERAAPTLYAVDVRQRVMVLETLLALGGAGGEGSDVAPSDPPETAGSHAASITANGSAIVASEGARAAGRRALPFPEEADEQSTSWASDFVIGCGISR